MKAKATFRMSSPVWSDSGFTGGAAPSPLRWEDGGAEGEGPPFSVAKYGEATCRVTGFFCSGGGGDDDDGGVESSGGLQDQGSARW